MLRIKYNHTIAIDLNDNVFGFGYNYHGQLGLGDTENKCEPTKLSVILRLNILIQVIIIQQL